MTAVTVTPEADVTGPPRDVVQRLNDRPAPDGHGVLARHWLVDRHRVRGRYFFESTADARAFANHPAESEALDELWSRVPSGTSLATDIEEVGDSSGVERPIFLVSAPRSGSTMLAETLALARGVWTPAAEGRAVVEGVAALHPARRGFESQRLTERDATAGVAPAVVAGYLAGRRGGRVLDQTPENALR